MNRTPQQIVDSLLNALDPLPHPQRMRELALRVRAMDELRPVLEELDARGPHERGIGIVAASVGRDAEWIADRIADPDAFVRGHALRDAEALQVPDSAYESALDDAPEAVRRELLRAIVTGRRTALADRLVDGLRSRWGDAEAARLLPGCTAWTVGRLLPGLFHAVTGWKTLAKRHPGLLLDVAEAEAAALPDALRATWWSRYAAGVSAAVAADPVRVLDLLERLGPATLPHQLRVHLPRFATADASRLLRMLLAPAESAVRRGRAPEPDVLRGLARSGAPELISYGRSLAESGNLAPLLRALPPARRHAFHRAVQEGRGGGQGAIDALVLEALPRSCVAEEARRMAADARARGAAWYPLLLAESFLPVAEVQGRLAEATRRPAAEDRAQAWPLLIRNAARSGDSAAVTSVLHDMGRLRNEQDPVRSAALGALAGVRPALFTEDAEPCLDRITADAVEARDSSPATRRHLSVLALSVLSEHAAGGSRELVNWALRTLVRISGSTGGADLGRLDAKLRRGQEHQVYEALRPWIEAGAEKADYSLAFAVARAVGRRAAGMPELQELLWQAIRYGNDTTVRTAVDLWLEPPATRDERVSRVLALDPSAIALWPVLQVVSRRRTDLLDPLLAEAPPYGRFLTRDAPWTVPVDRDVRRWVPRQQLAVVGKLTEEVEDAGLPLYRRAAALALAALVPGHGTELVRRWTEAPDVVLAEAALAALARTDRPADALPELLARAGDDRARVAVYAATRASRYAAPSHLAGHLRAVLFAPDAKVTSRKEAARLAAARLPAARAAELLTEAYAAPGAHVDVRAAVVAFTGGLLDEEPVWGVLRDAAAAEPVLRAAVLRVTALDLPAPHRERYARLVREVTTTDDPETATLAFAALARWAPWSPEAPTVLAAATTDLTDRTSWRAAAQGLVAVAVGSPGGVDGFEQALRALAQADTEAGAAAGAAGSGSGAAGGAKALAVTEAGASARADAEERRDRPARQRLAHLVACLARRAATDPEAVRPAALAAVELLAGYDAFVPHAAALAVTHLDLEADPRRLERLAALTTGRPALAVRTAGELEARLRAQTGDPDALLAAVRRLAAHGGHAEGLLAVAVTAAIGTRTGWAAPWRDRLRALRRHPVPDVRDAALNRPTAQE
ncbi:hypothetical protein [Streptomyces sp. NPDC005046]